VRAKIGVEDAKSCESVGWFPCVLKVLVSFPMNKVVGSVGAMVMSKDPFGDEEFLGFGFNDGRRILMLIGETGGVREKE
jgi:hypothetical protein